jgi:hypothetical protein
MLRRPEARSGGHAVRLGRDPGPNPFAETLACNALSGTARPSSFGLETGRLCVMASRHKVSVVIVSRDHVGDTLREHIPSADQPIGCDDVTGRAHASNLAFWEYLERQNLVISR